ncbi:tensin-1-like isoform X2 [Liolophura sinensis]|uniref:tensin-1-like isoform X2 n=1 Tax=Liolophura sinensis TaxID=3198878 RepID=UPI0031581BFC
MNSGLLSMGNSPEELDSLIQSFEYENQQIVKLIEKENQLLEGLEKEIIQKKSEIECLQESSTQLDEETKRVHKQFIQNRDNCDSLRKTACVLLDHEVALMKKLNAVVVTGEQEKTDRRNVLQHYTNIWEDYKQKYESFPLAQTFLQKQKEIETSSARLDEVNKKIEELETAIAELKGPDVDIYDMKHFLVAIAQLKLDSRKNCKMIIVKQEKLQALERELCEIKQRKQKQKNIEEERARKLQAKAEEEQSHASESMPQADVSEQDNSVQLDNRESQMSSASGYSQTGVNSTSTEKLTQAEIGLEKSTLAHMYDGGDRMFQQPNKDLILQKAAYQSARSQPHGPLPNPARSQSLPSRSLPLPAKCQPAGSQPQVLQHVQCHQQPASLPQSYGIHAGNMGHSHMITSSAQLKYMPKTSAMGGSQMQSQSQPSSYFLLAPLAATPGQSPNFASSSLHVTPRPSGLGQPPIIQAPVTEGEGQLGQAVFKHPNQLGPDQGKSSPSGSSKSSSCEALTGQQRLPPQDTGKVPEAPLCVPQSPQVGSRASVFQDTCPTPKLTQDYSQERPSAQHKSEAELIPSPLPHTQNDGTALSPRRKEPKTPEHREDGIQMSQPTTPAQHGTEDNNVSPFNLERHLERVRLLTKSPAAPQYSTRPMFATEPSVPEKAAKNEGNNTMQDNPFFQSFFPDGRGDGKPFQSAFMSPDLAESGGKSLFGPADSPAHTEQGQSMSFNFSGGDNSGAGASDAGSVFSLFGGGPPDTTAGDSDGFSFSFGTSSVASPPPTPVSGTFTLF